MIEIYPQVREALRAEMSRAVTETAVLCKLTPQEYAQLQTTCCLMAERALAPAFNQPLPHTYKVLEDKLKDSCAVFGPSLLVEGITLQQTQIFSSAIMAYSRFTASLWEKTLYTPDQIHAPARGVH